MGLSGLHRTCMWSLATPSRVPLLSSSAQGGRGGVRALLESSGTHQEPRATLHEQDSPVDQRGHSQPARDRLG